MADRRPRGVWREGAAGAAAFAAAHLVERWRWTEWFGGAGEHAPWFLNSGRAVAFTAAALFIVGAIGARSLGGAGRAGGIAMAAGAVTSMIVVLTIVGPGTLFPIVIGVGAAIVTVSTMVGWMLGRKS